MTSSAISAKGAERSNYGVVTLVRGSMVDVRLKDSLPPIYSLSRAGTAVQVAIDRKPGQRQKGRPL